MPLPGPGGHGQGGSGEVKLACHLFTGTEVAMKVLPKVEQNFASTTQAGPNGDGSTHM